MAKFEIRSSSLIAAAALALTPAFALAEGGSKAPTTTTTTTTTPPQSSTVTQTAPSDTNADINRQGANQQGAQQMSPSVPPSSGNAASIDPAQVQRVFGMDVALIDLKALNTDQVKVLQQRLSERGFYRGKMDGKMGPMTQNALSSLMTQQYALNQRLVSQGQITEQFASSIGVDTAGRAPVSGTDVSDKPSQHDTRSSSPVHQ